MIKSAFPHRLFPDNFGDKSSVPKR